MNENGQSLLVFTCTLFFLTVLVLCIVIFGVNRKKDIAASENTAYEETLNASDATTTQCATAAQNKTRTTWISEAEITEPVARSEKTTPARPEPKVPKEQTTGPSAEGTRTVPTTPQTSATTTAMAATSETTAHAETLTSATTRSSEPVQKLPAASATRNATVSETETQPAAMSTRAMTNALTLKKGPALPTAVTQSLSPTTRVMRKVTGALGGKEMSKKDLGTARELAPTSPALPVRRETASHKGTSTKEEAGTLAVRVRPESSSSAPPETSRNHEMRTLRDMELNVASGSSADKSKRLPGSAPVVDAQLYDDLELQNIRNSGNVDDDDRWVVRPLEV